MKCSIEGCKKPGVAKNLCDTHYRRVLHNGDLYLRRAENGKGTMQKTRGFYTQIRHKGRLRLEHIVLAEKALGRPLPKGAKVHHMNEVPWDNHTYFNLVICPDQAYHMLLHKRMRTRGKTTVKRDE